MFFAGSLMANTASAPEGAATRNLQRLFEQYRRIISQVPIANWQQVELVDKGLHKANSMLAEGNVTKFYSFIPLADRSKFPKGALVLVQYKAMPWPDALKTENPAKNGEFLFHPSQQDVRYLIYESSKGELQTERWYETKFQAMLAETGLTIPPPTPYYPPPPTPPGEKPAATSSPAVLVIAAETAPAVAPEATPASAPIAPPPAKSANPRWWIAGAIAVLVALWTILARRKARR